MPSAPSLQHGCGGAVIRASTAAWIGASGRAEPGMPAQADGSAHGPPEQPRWWASGLWSRAAGRQGPQAAQGQACPPVRLVGTRLRGPKARLTASLKPEDTRGDGQGGGSSAQPRRFSTRLLGWPAPRYVMSPSSPSGGMGRSAGERRHAHWHQHPGSRLQVGRTGSH